MGGGERRLEHWSSKREQGAGKRGVVGEWERGAASACDFGYQHEREGRSWGVEEDGADKVPHLTVGERERERWVAG